MDRRTKRTLIRRLNRDAAVIATRFGLRYRSIEAEAANVKRRYGICYSDGTIRIRLRHASTGRPLKYSSLISTLCHELAHLEYFNHGYDFQNFYAVILEYAREQGIYRPGRRAAAAPISPAETVGEPAETTGLPAPRTPRQLSLF
jgi:predicted metal-dependent hydrolase